jgi:hypothetical protein
MIGADTIGMQILLSVAIVPNGFGARYNWSFY